jgi:autotransporter-associated beta strand protein
MNEHPPLEPVGDASLEARIVAWVLGEATAFEAGELERLCDERPELLVFRRRMRALHGLLSEAESAEADEAWKLPPEKRVKIEELFGENTPEQDIPILRPAPPSRSLLKPGRLHQRRRSEGQAAPSRWFAKTILTAAACVMFGMLYRFGFDATKSSSILAVNEKSVNFKSSGEMDEDTRLKGSVEIIGGSRFSLLPESPVARQVESSRSLVEKDLQAGQKQNLQAAEGGFSYKTKAAQAVADTESLATASKPQMEVIREFKYPTENEPPELPNSVAFSGKVLERTADPFAANGGAAAGDADPFASAPADAPAQKAKLAASRPVYEPKPGAANSKRVFAEGAVSNFAIPDPGDNFGEMSSLSSFERDKGGAGLGAGSGGGFGANDDFDVRRVEIEGEPAARDREVRREVPASPNSAFGGGEGGAMPAAGGATLSELAKNGAGSLELSGGNTYNGRTQATAGVLGIEGTDSGAMADSAKGTKSPIGEDQVESSLLTGGLRSGDAAINRNSIDAVLNNPNRSSGQFLEVPPADKPGEPSGELAEFQSLKPAMPAAQPAPAAVAPQKSKAAKEKMLSDSIVFSDPDSPKKTSEDLQSDQKSAPEEAPATSLSGLAQREMIRRQVLSGDKAVDQLASRRSEELKKIDKTWELTDTKDSAPTAMFESPLRGIRMDEKAVDATLANNSDALQRDRVSKLEVLREQKEGAAIDMAVDAQDYVDAKRELDTAQEMLNTMKVKLIGETIQERIPTNSIIVHEDPVVAVNKPGWLSLDRRYESTAVVQVKPNTLNLASDGSGPMNQQFFATEFEIAKSRNILMKVAEQLELPTKWELPKEKVVEELQKSIEITNRPGTDLMDIKVKNDNAEDARDIAAEVTKAYKNARNEIATRDADATLQALRKAVRDQEDKVEERRKLLTTIVRTKGILPPSQSNPSALSAAPKPAPAPVPVPTDELSANSEAFSTFSLHVSDASFKVAKAALDRGERPDPESVRPEEFYNAFDYGDPTPAPGEPVACAIEQAAHPILPQRNLVRVAMRTGAAGRAASQPLALTVLLDHSGSMEREDRHEGLNQAIVQLASLLKAGDTITVAGFSRTPRLMADRLPGERAKELIDIVRNTPSEGGTNLEEALKLGGDLALRQKNPAAQNRIVLLTDGAANLGNAKPEDLAERIRALRQQGISFDAAGRGGA